MNRYPSEVLLPKWKHRNVVQFPEEIRKNKALFFENLPSESDAVSTRADQAPHERVLSIFNILPLLRVRITHK